MRPTKSIHFFFDLGGVLFAVQRQLVWLGLADHSKLNAVEIQNAFIEDGALILYETGQIKTNEFMQRLAHLAQVKLTKAELTSIWQSALKPIESNLEQIRHLSATFDVALISNTNAAHLQRIYDLAPFLRNLPASFSHEIGFMKPRSEIFTHALRQMDTSNSLNIFIDDRLDNITAAKGVGFDAIQLSEPSNLQSILNKTLKQ